MLSPGSHPTQSAGHGKLDPAASANLSSQHPLQTHSLRGPRRAVRIGGMLRHSLRALQRLSALQQAACSAANAIGGGAGQALPSLAAALQRLALQQPSWAAGGARHYAAGGGGGEAPPPATAAAGADDAQEEEEEAHGPLVLQSESGALTFADADEALEEWGKAMDEGGRCGLCAAK